MTILFYGILHSSLSGGFAVCYDSNAVLKGYIDELIKDCVFDFCLDIRNEELQCSYPQDCADTCLNAGFPVGIWQRRGFCGKSSFIVSELAQLSFTHLGVKALMVSFCQVYSGNK